MNGKGDAQLERRIKRVARRCARVVLELEREGQHDGAMRLREVAIAVIADMRRRAAAIRHGSHL